MVWNTTAYGQSGRAELSKNLTELGSPPVIEEAIDVSVKDMLPVLSKVRAANADALLLHNRKIQRRVDDSVVQAARTGRVQIFRRARGYSPKPTRLAAFGHESENNIPPILAVGPELKNTVCLYHAGRAVLSEHIGDLKDGRTYQEMEKIAESFGRGEPGNSSGSA